MSIFASISKNKLELFDFSSVKKTDRVKEQIATLKKNCSLFSRLFIGCQTKEGNLEEFFYMRTKVVRHHCHKMVHSDLATNLTCSKCLEKVHPSFSEVLATDAVILDGAAIVNMVQPRGCKTFQDYA